MVRFVMRIQLVERNKRDVGFQLEFLLMKCGFKGFANESKVYSERIDKFLICF